MSAPSPRAVIQGCSARFGSVVSSHAPNRRTTLESTQCRTVQVEGGPHSPANPTAQWDRACLRQSSSQKREFPQLSLEIFEQLLFWRQGAIRTITPKLQDFRAKLTTILGRSNARNRTSDGGIKIRCLAARFQQEPVRPTGKSRFSGRSLKPA